MFDCRWFLVSLKWSHKLLVSVILRLKGFFSDMKDWIQVIQLNMNYLVFLTQCHSGSWFFKNQFHTTVLSVTHKTRTVQTFHVFSLKIKLFWVGFFIKVCFVLLSKFTTVAFIVNQRVNMLEFRTRSFI